MYHTMHVPLSAHAHEAKSQNFIGNLIGVQRETFQTGFILRESPLEPDELLIC